MNILELLTEELKEFIDKIIASSNYTDYNGNPIAEIYLDSIEIDTVIHLNLYYYRKYFQKIVHINNAVAGWSVENKRNTYLYIPMEITQVGNSICIDSWYQGKTLYTIGIVEDNEINFNSIQNDIESKTVSDLLSKIISLIEIRIQDILEEQECEDWSD